MAKAISDAPQHHPLCQARPALADDDQPGVALFGDR